MRKNIDRNTGNLILCIAEAAIGILLLIDPIGFTSGIIMALGLVLGILGIKELLDYFRTEPETAAKSNGLAKGLLMVLGGIFCIFRAEWFIITFPILTMFYGVLTLVGGISKIQWAVDMLRQKQKYWFIEVLGAVLTIIFAILILTAPFASTAFLWTFIGVSLIAEAIIDILAFVLGRT